LPRWGRRVRVSSSAPGKMQISTIRGECGASRAVVARRCPRDAASSSHWSSWRVREDTRSHRWAGPGAAQQDGSYMGLERWGLRRRLAEGGSALSGIGRAIRVTTTRSPSPNLARTPEASDPTSSGAARSPPLRRQRHVTTSKRNDKPTRITTANGSVGRRGCKPCSKRRRTQERRVDNRS
jgi:hypothetical protein